jgi:DNA primase
MASIDFELYTDELLNVLNGVVATLPDAKKTYKGFQFRCPLCGDHKEKWKMGRGHLLLNKTPYVYHCFNHGCNADSGMSASRFLQQAFPMEYRNYIKDLSAMAHEDEEKKQARRDKAAASRYVVERKLPVNADTGKPDITNVKEFVERNFKKLADMKKMTDYPEAVEFCEKRHITREVYKKWLFVKNESNPLNNRIIIPFKNSKKQIYFYQARTIVGAEPKYLNSLSDMKPIYNYYEADFEKEVMIVEGPIDSRFLENSIAILGVKYDDRMIRVIKKKRWVFDDDRAGRVTAKERLEAGDMVFLWKKFKHAYKITSTDKCDFNDLAIKLNKEIFTYKELEPYFSNHIRSLPLL